GTSNSLEKERMFFLCSLPHPHAHASPPRRREPPLLRQPTPFSRTPGLYKRRP
uniref:Uncharacterized protein n=1 Tax=Aegilops tauschii subsp. strangulata TaxID=200361 RepID=A0A453SRF0_AEGTS